MNSFMSLRNAGLFLLLTLLMAHLIAPAHAAMSLSRTRLIVTAKEREATIEIRSEDESPILLQTWIDIDSETGPEAGAPDSKDTPVPFITDPPMFRVDPKSSRQVRVLLVQPPANMPDGEEVLFWFNAHETPTRPPGNLEGENYIQLAFQVRIKLFYRPAALANYTLTDAHKLRFTLARNDKGEPVLNIRNPAPIHQSIGTLTLAHGDERMELDAPMLAPNSQLQLALPSPPPATSGLRVVYGTINDDGELMEDEQTI